MPAKSGCDQAAADGNLIRRGFNLDHDLSGSKNKPGGDDQQQETEANCQSNDSSIVAKWTRSRSSPLGPKGQGLDF